MAPNSDSGGKVQHVKPQWLSIFCGLGFFGAMLSQARVQVFESRKITDKANEMKKLELSRVDYPRRGSIVSADGKALAEDLDSYELRLNYNKAPNVDGFYMALSQATGIPASEFAHQSQGKYRIVYWRQPISAERKEAIAHVKTEWRAEGLSLERVERRFYPMGDEAATLVGVYRGKEDTPKPPIVLYENPVIGARYVLTTPSKALNLGLEKGLDQSLAGEKGLTTGLVDRTGAFLPLRYQNSPRKDGEAILTTIESDIQSAAAGAVRDAVENFKAKNGTAVVMNPKTGDILAMASWPTFDPNRESNVAGANVRRSQINGATQLRFEPGSTFKILTLAKAIDEGKWRPDEMVNCTGQLFVGKRYVHCDSHHGNRAHGVITPEIAIAKSCNVAAATWALRVGREGPNGMVSFLENLGLLNKPELGLPQESVGQFRRNEPNKQFQIATVGFGQSLATTPVSLCSAFAALGNGGVRMKPRLVQRVGDKVNSVKPVGRLFKPETCSTVVRFMESVIESDAGTGKGQRIEGYRLAGKTGTAQKIGQGKGYVSNFVGFVPAENPRAVVLVMINDPQKEYYGALVAGPAFKTIAQSVIHRYQIPKDSVASVAPEPSKATEKVAPKAEAKQAAQKISQPEPAVKAADAKKPKAGKVREMMVKPMAPRSPKPATTPGPSVEVDVT